MSTRRFSKGRNGLYTPVVESPAGASPFYYTSFADGYEEFNGFTWDNIKNTDPVIFDGRTCLEYRYSDGEPGSQNAEQYWNMGRNLSHVWISYEMFIPANFAHPNVAPSNNKWMQFWREIYSDVGTGTLQFGYEYQRAGANSSTIRVMARRWNLNSVTSSNSTGDYLPTGQNALFIDAGGPMVIDDWNLIQYEFKTASSDSGTDGIQRMWINNSLFVEITTGKFWNYPASAETPLDCYLRRGYFMGSANALFTVPTTFYQTAVEFYQEDPGWLV